MAEKHDSIITLPGGVENYAETLHQALSFVEAESPTREEFADWVLETFPEMSSQGSAEDKGRLLGRMSAAEVDDDDRFQLTELGHQLLNNPPQENIELYFETLTKNYIGFETLLQALKQQPASIEKLRDVLNAVHDKDWDSIYQAEYRVNWLRSLGIVEKDQDKVRLTSRGQDIAEEYPPLDIDISDLSEPTIQAPTNGSDPQSNIGLEEFDDDVTYYWVNQSNAAEREGNYLRSSDTYYTRDLTKLNPGDVLIHYWEGGVRAYSVVQNEAYEVSGEELEGAEDEETYWRVDIDLHLLDPIRDIETIASVLRRDDIRQDREKYAINATGVQSWYLCNLTPAAAEYLLSTYPDEPSEAEPDKDRYFWVTANPEIRAPENIANSDGEDGRVFFEAHNSRRNKRRIYDAFERADPGDEVVFYESAPTQEIVALGTVVQELHEEDGTTGITIEYDRSVEGISWNDLTAVGELEDSAPIRQNARGSIFELEQNEYETILALEPEPPDQEDVERLRDRLSLPSISISIPDGLYFDDKTRITREIEAALEADKHIIFTGPPGTGKTKLATHVAKLATDYDAVDDYRFTTATADWTAFDTIGGYVPNRNKHGQELLFEPRLFLQCFRDATGVKNEWLVIDELNRADIDKAMGQLFSVLSGDSTELPYERDEAIAVESLDADADDKTLEDIVSSTDTFPVTPAWRLLATMNTYDKASLYELSYAFMRRFAFIHVGIPELEEEGELRTSLLLPNGDENFASAWTEQLPDLEAPLEKWGEELTEIWHRVNEERAIGPAIVHDMVRYIANYDGRAPPEEAFTSALTTHVYPQLEGLRQEKQRKIIEGLCSGDVPVNPDRLWYQANDFLGLPDTRDNE